MGAYNIEKELQVVASPFEGDHVSRDQVEHLFKKERVKPNPFRVLLRFVASTKVQSGKVGIGFKVPLPAAAKYPYLTGVEDIGRTPVHPNLEDRIAVYFCGTYRMAYNTLA